MKTPSRPSRGFTLIEVLIGMSILAMIMGIVYAAFVPSLEATESVNEQRALYRRARIVLGRMENELRSAFLGRYPASYRRKCQLDERDCPYLFIGESHGEKDEITFTTLAGKPKSRTPQSDQLWLRYYVEHDSESNVDSLLREERPIHDGDFFNTEPRTIELFRNVTRFDLRYVEIGTTNDYTEEWDSTHSIDQDQYHNLPRALELSIAFGDELGHEVTLNSLIELAASQPPKEDEP